MRWREGYSKSEIARMVGRHRDTELLNSTEIDPVIL